MVAFSITSSGSSLRPDRRVSHIVLAGAGAMALAACGADAEGSARAEDASAKWAPVELAGADLSDVEEIDPTALEELTKSSKVRLIDVRTDEEVADGMIPGAEHIALDEFEPEKLDLSDGREPVLYCRSDRRSGIAAEKLAQHIGKKVKHLDGGITAWREKGLPIKRPAVF